MTKLIVAALALSAASSLHAQAAAPQTPAAPADLSYATALSGNWSWKPVADGSEITFADAYARPQLSIRCTRSQRVVTIAKPATGAAPFLNVWTSSLVRNLPASFNPATALVSASVTAFDPLLDALASSRGRIGLGVSGTTALVVPPWAEVARVIEDCRV